MIRARAVVERAERRGPRTSEFWLVALAIVAPMGLALAGVERRRLRDVTIGAGIAAAGYALGRSYVKGSLARLSRLDADDSLGTSRRRRESGSESFGKGV